MKATTLHKSSVDEFQRRLRLVPAVHANLQARSPRRMVALLVLCDMAAVLVAWALAGGVYAGLMGRPNVLERLQTMAIALPLFSIAYAAKGLYPAILVSAADELRRTTAATTLVFLTLAAASFLTRTADAGSRGVYLLAWVSTLALVPLGRAVARAFASHRAWWGVPAFVVGAGKTGDLCVRTLTRNPRLGIHPVAVFDDDVRKVGQMHGVPVVHGLAKASDYAHQLGIDYCVVAMPGQRRERVLQLVTELEKTFTHVLVIPNMFGLSSLWVEAKDIYGFVGVEIRNRLLSGSAYRVKRTFDLVLGGLASLMILPLIGLLAAAIKLDDRGPVFYRQRRVGRGGREFDCWKFRTMVPNAEKTLREVLESDPELRAEWERDQKLRNDPRVTRVGHFLRATSLDELPQIFNVFRGEMSLIGPRPVPVCEIEAYGKDLELYARVLPGITGLWQVSGRNHTTYEERVTLNNYYVRNWSIWLDFYILFRTPVVLITRDGAY